MADEPPRRTLYRAGDVIQRHHGPPRRGVPGGAVPWADAAPDVTEALAAGAGLVPVVPGTVVNSAIFCRQHMGVARMLFGLHATTTADVAARDALSMRYTGYLWAQLVYLCDARRRALRERRLALRDARTFTEMQVERLGQFQPGPVLLLLLRLRNGAGLREQHTFRIREPLVVDGSPRVEVGSDLPAIVFGDAWFAGAADERYRQGGDFLISLGPLDRRPTIDLATRFTTVVSAFARATHVDDWYEVSIAQVVLVYPLAGAHGVARHRQRPVRVRLEQHTVLAVRDDASLLAAMPPIALPPAIVIAPPAAAREPSAASRASSFWSDLDDMYDGALDDDDGSPSSSDAPGFDFDMVD